MSMQIPDNVTSLDQVRPEGDRTWNEKKKERARGQLSEAAVRLLALRGLDCVSVNDIAAEVSMASGTFYNYFPSLEALLEELAVSTAAALEEISASRSKARDPGTRIALVLRAALRRARDDANWGRLLVHFAARSQYAVRTVLLRSIEDDIIDGIGKGQFSAEVDEAAPDLVVGALLCGVQRVAEGHVDTGYERNLTTNILRGLGMVSAAALERAQRGL